MIRFLYGEDQFRLNEKLKQLKEEFFKKNTSNASLGVFDFKEKFLLNEIKTSIKSRGLFADKILIVVKNISLVEDKKLRDDCYSFLDKNLIGLDNDNIELIFIEEEKIAKNDKILKWFLKNIKTEEFKNLNEAQLKKWIGERFNSLNVEVPNDLIDKLLENCSNNLVLINNEILKIANYIGDKKDDIDKESLLKLLNTRVEADIFKTIEFLSAGNKKMAIETLHKQLDKGDDSFYILSMYIYQFRNLLKIADFYFNGLDNNFEIAKLTKLHPFVVQKGIQQLQGFDILQLKNIYQKLEKIDIEAKTGKKDIRINLDLLVTQI